MKEYEKYLKSVFHVNTEDSIILEDRIEYILDEYRKFYNTYTSKDMTYQYVKDVRNFIDKLAIFYEIQFSDDKIQEMMDEDFDFININEELENKTKEELDRILSHVEKMLISKPVYPSLTYLKNDKGSHLHLDQNGYIYGADIYEDNIDPKDFDGLHINEAIKLFIEKGIRLPDNSEVIESATRTDYLFELREKLLNAVYYKIIERGNDIYGVRRALIFANNYIRNIDTAMQYGYSYSDKDFGKLIDGYTDIGGTLDLNCYINYTRRKNKYDSLHMLPLKLIKQYHFPDESMDKEKNEEEITLKRIPNE